MERSKSVVEPAGAAGLAYLVSKKPSPGKKVVPILCGGNIDMYLLGQIVAKGLATMGRMVKIFILLKDKPGALKEVVDELALLSANIVEVVHDRLSSNVRAGTTGVTLSLETEDQKHMDKLIQHLKEKNKGTYLNFFLTNFFRPILLRSWDSLRTDLCCFSL